MNAPSTLLRAELPALLGNYRPVAGIPDELIGPNGEVRPVWRDFAQYFAALGPEQIASRIAIGDQYLGDSGVFFRQADGDMSVERSWPLSHVPVLIAEDEWNVIVEGLTQRADLLEAVVRDLYGPNRLVENGSLPAVLVAQNPEWLRPVVGVQPASGNYLHFLSFELGRSPTGQWWVLNDRAQSPSGAGFALENRVATSRMYSDFFANANIHRLAGFFRAFRESLHDFPNGPPAILTPGPHADTYFEHAYIARYLGLLLVEGEDLIVEGGQVKVRTVAGSQPISVLWRRLDARFSDPLELDETSQIGTPGLVGALRQKGVSVINAIGSGVVETRALMAFLPRISEDLTGEALRLPNVATWWCGQPTERDYVRDNIDAMMISPAMSTRLPFDPEDTTALGGTLRSSAYRTVKELMETESAFLVGQEAVTLSTSPAWQDGALQPRPMTLRVFLARTRNGWVAMPGGYARIGRSNDVTALGMHAGGSCADVWVVSDQPTPVETMIPSQDAIRVSRKTGDLPSRVADNLFWLGRYVERSEFLARIYRAYDIRLAEHPAPDSPLLVHMEGYLRYLGVEVLDDRPTALDQAVRSLAQCAMRVRDRLSPDGLVTISMIEDLVEGDADTSIAERMGILLRQLVGFSGLIHENMYRSMAWRFVSLGRAIERAITTTSMVASLADPAAPRGSMEVALDCADSKLAHHNKYAFGMSTATVTELLCCDNQNPRSLRYQLERLDRDLAALPEIPTREQIHATVTELFGWIDNSQPEDLDGARLLEMNQTLSTISERIADAYLR